MSLAAVPTRSVTAAGKAASTPFGASQAFSKQQLSCRPCQSSASAAMQRMASVDMAMARSFSGSAPLQRARSRATHTTPALSALAEHGGFLDLVSIITATSLTLYRNCLVEQRPLMAHSFCRGANVDARFSSLFSLSLLPFDLICCTACRGVRSSWSGLTLLSTF